MFKEKNYNEGIKKAENLMSDDQKLASDKRAKFKFQDRDPFDSFMEHIKQDGERREATEEEKEKMDKKIIQLGKLFKDADIKWILDGALNVSLLNGDYIGIHKDLDISIEKNELEKLNGILEKRGYGLFLSYSKDAKNPNSKKMMERVGARDFSEASQDNLMIAAIDEDGRIKEDEDLNFIDVHLIERNEKGESIGVDGATIPEKWQEARLLNFKGENLNLAHPAKVAYYKLHGTRNYDFTDLENLAKIGELNKYDVNEMKEVLQREFEIMRKLIEDISRWVAGRISTKSSEKEISQILMQEPHIAEKIREADSPLIIEISKKIAKSEDKSAEKITNLIFEMIDVGRFKPLRDKMDILAQWIDGADNLKRSRENINNT